MDWTQAYDPLGNVYLSTACAALPVIVLLGGLAFGHIKAHIAALLGLAAALIVAIAIFGMPTSLALATAGYGAAYGLLPIGWIVLNVIFLYQLTSDAGLFATLRHSITAVTKDTRLQLLLVAFSFGAFFEGASGFGTPVAITGALLIGLGFTPLAASGLSLIANTAPVAFGALGTPIIALQGVTQLDLFELSAMVGRQLPFFSLIVPFWLVWAYAGRTGVVGVWPAILVAGSSFAALQFLMSNYHGPWLVDIVAAIGSIGAVVLFLRVWQPNDQWTPTWGRETAVAPTAATAAPPRADVIRAWVPWLILSVIVFIWGIPQVRAWLDGISVLRIPVPALHLHVFRTPPVVAAPTAEAAIFNINWLSATGTGIFLAAIIAGFVMGRSVTELARTYARTLVLVSTSLLTISAMMALGFTTRYSGVDATLGLAFAGTGMFYPFFGTMLGWLGVALTGSDTSSNVLFGSLQRITAEQLGLSPTLMAAANSSGGVMGKMIDAQSIVVASTATRWYGHEGEILRFVFWHSVVLACLVGVLVYLQAYVDPFSRMTIW
ncbi:MAG TPA: L-lactate permease [Vicinamibacterales bacterium]|nr:L-lactate permease [Vicinamibacterales bacterium]